MSETNKSAQASATDRDSGGCAGVTCSGYVEVKTVEVKIGDEFWCPHTKRWLPVEVRAQQMGVCIGGYLVRRKLPQASSPNDRTEPQPRQ